MYLQVVIFDEAAMLPVYVVKTAQPRHLAGHGHGAAAKEPLKGLETARGDLLIRESPRSVSRSPATIHT